MKAYYERNKELYRLRARYAYAVKKGNVEKAQELKAQIDAYVKK